MKIDGFDLGNSPAEYTRDAVGGRPVVLTTTNGTAALLRCTEADEVLVGGFANLSVLCDRLAGGDRPVHLVCAGTDGKIAGEDALAAAAILAEVLGREEGLIPKRWGGEHYVGTNDAGRLILSAWRDAPEPGDGLGHHFLTTRGGQNLLAVNRRPDVFLCAQANTAPVLPRFDPRRGEIVAG